MRKPPVEHPLGKHRARFFAAFRAQADALEIEALAKHRLADEYDAAQERGEVVGRKGGGSTLPNRKGVTSADVGLTYKDIHEARQIRNAEAADPGIVRRTLDDALSAGKEPTKAQLRKAVSNPGRPPGVMLPRRDTPQ